MTSPLQAEPQHHLDEQMKTQVPTVVTRKQEHMLTAVIIITSLDKIRPVNK